MTTPQRAAGHRDAGEWANAYQDIGYEYCRTCTDWHRPPECPVDDSGKPLHPWIRYEDGETCTDPCCEERI
jgi:hypothetical protein